MTAPCIARILVVENDPRTRGQLTDMLAKPGFIVQAAEGQGPDLQANARMLASRFRPHVVVMDLRLLDDAYNADRSGLELLKDKSFSFSRCVLYSAYLNHDYKVTREALVEARVADVVGKEDSPQRLINAVEQAARNGCICGKEFSIAWPSAWNEETVIKTLYGDESPGIPPDIVMDILGHLFPDARTVILKSIEGAARSSASIFRGRAALFQAWADDREPVVVKLTRRDRAEQEVTSYDHYIQDRLVGRFYAHLQKSILSWELGGICYSFIGSSQKSIEAFAAFYQQRKSPDEIVRPLAHFFGEVWNRHYKETRKPLAGSLFDAYDSFLKLTLRLRASGDQQETIVFPGLPGKFPNPLRWIPKHATDSLIPTATQAVTHGDLHGDNLFVDAGNAWAIDFERSGPGPVLRDFVELEQDIVTRLVSFPGNELRPFYELLMILATPVSPADAFAIPANYQQDQTGKALGVIQGLRSLACQVTDFADMREYYWGLLLDAAFGVLLAEKYSTLWWRGMLFASVLCERLKDWGRGWPPADWASTNTAARA